MTDIEKPNPRTLAGKCFCGAVQYAVADSFRYAMNCSTLLAVTFLDKGEPKIASLWYQRALEVPGLDPETILALRYDLGVSLETAISRLARAGRGR